MAGATATPPLEATAASSRTSEGLGAHPPTYGVASRMASSAAAASTAGGSAAFAVTPAPLAAGAIAAGGVLVAARPVAPNGAVLRLPARQRKRTGVSVRCSPMMQTELPSTPTHTIYLLRVPELLLLLALVLLLLRASLALPRQGQTSSVAAA